MRFGCRPLRQIASFFKASFTETPVYPLVDETFFGGDDTDLNALMAWFKAMPNWGLQDDGLTATTNPRSAVVGPSRRTRGA